MGRPILCLDFDGVMHSYSSGWQGAAVVPDPPVPGMFEFLEAAAAKFDIHVLSSRSRQEGGIDAMHNWLVDHGHKHFNCDPANPDEQYLRLVRITDAITWATEKPAAFVTIDDRAITFDGTWPAIATLLAFKPWNKR